MNVTGEESSIEGQEIGAYLDALASAAPTPGGGAAAALSAATGAALVSMVCNLTIGRERYKAHDEAMRAARDEAALLRGRALALADEDGAAFRAVGAAYGLPRSSDEEKAARTAAIQDALKGATATPLRTMETAARVAALCASVVSIGNPNVVSDVGVGALSARAALDGAALNVTINLSLIRDAAFVTASRDRLHALLDEASPRIAFVLRAVEAAITR